jgi:protein gp37
MAENSDIQWTDHTWNPWIGCTQVSPGCANCYAKTMMDDRYGRVKWGAGQERSRTSEANWKHPAKWNRQAEKLGIRYRVFCSSLADIFDNEVSVEWRQDAFRVIESCKNLDWLLLTKRPQNIISMVESISGDFFSKWARQNPHVWFGCTIEDQQRYNERSPYMQDVRSRGSKVFYSCEPLLGRVNLYLLSNPVDWVIVGGESGSKARETSLSAIRGVVHQCQANETPCLVKQLGKSPVTMDGDRWSISDSHGGNIDEFPSDLKIREFPAEFNQVLEGAIG